MANLWAMISTLVAMVIEWAGDYLTLITSNEVLMLYCIAIPLVGIGIGVIKRLVRIRA